jgi:hypothetical protein
MIQSLRGCQSRVPQIWVRKAEGIVGLLQGISSLKMWGYAKADVKGIESAVT